MLYKIYHFVFGCVIYSFLAGIVLTISYILSVISTGISTILSFLLVPFMSVNIGWPITKIWIKDVLSLFINNVVIDGFEGMFNTHFVTYVKEDSNSVKR